MGGNYAIFYETFLIKTAFNVLVDAIFVIKELKNIFHAIIVTGVFCKDYMLCD